MQSEADGTDPFAYAFDAAHRQHAEELVALSGDLTAPLAVSRRCSTGQETCDDR